MDDLKKLEEKFHEYLKTKLDEKRFDINEIKITEKLFHEQEAFYIPFGWVSYFLVVEDGKAVVYANAISRMDLDLIAFIDEGGYEEYDVWNGDHPDVWKKFNIHEQKVKCFNHDDLQFVMKDM